jgi:hypothetical protein
MTYTKWTKEHDEIVISCVGLGWTAREIATEFGLSEDTIKKKRVSLGLSGINPHNKSIPHNRLDLSREELISILLKEEKRTFEQFSSSSNLPSPSVYRRVFGSWGAALKAAGLPPNKSSMLEDSKTIVYLVEFDGFYKIGITQQLLKSRLASHPKYEVVMVLEFDNLKDAKAKEKEWLKAIAANKIVPDNFPSEGRGATECFKL